MKSPVVKTAALREVTVRQRVRIPVQGVRHRPVYRHTGVRI